MNRIPILSATKRKKFAILFSSVSKEGTRKSRKGKYSTFSKIIPVLINPRRQTFLILSNIFPKISSYKEALTSVNRQRPVDLPRTLRPILMSMPPSQPPQLPPLPNAFATNFPETRYWKDPSIPSNVPSQPPFASSASTTSITDSPTVNNLSPAFMSDVDELTRTIGSFRTARSNEVERPLQLTKTLIQVRLVPLARDLQRSGEKTLSLLGANALNNFARFQFLTRTNFLTNDAIRAFANGVTALLSIDPPMSDINVYERLSDLTTLNFRRVAPSIVMAVERAIAPALRVEPIPPMTDFTYDELFNLLETTNVGRNPEFSKFFDTQINLLPVRERDRILAMLQQDSTTSGRRQIENTPAIINTFISKYGLDLPTDALQFAVETALQEMDATTATRIINNYLQRNPENQVTFQRAIELGIPISRPSTPADPYVQDLLSQSDPSLTGDTIRTAQNLTRRVSRPVRSLARDVVQRVRDNPMATGATAAGLISLTSMGNTAGQAMLQSVTGRLTTDAITSSLGLKGLPKTLAETTIAPAVDFSISAAARGAEAAQQGIEYAAETARNVADFFSNPGSNDQVTEAIGRIDPSNDDLSTSLATGALAAVAAPVMWALNRQQQAPPQP